MRGRDDIGSTFNLKRVLDSTEHRMNRRMQAESLFDDVGLQFEFLQVLICKRGKIGSQNSDLFLIQLFGNLGL